MGDVRCVESFDRAFAWQDCANAICGQRLDSPSAWHDERLDNNPRYAFHTCGILPAVVGEAQASGCLVSTMNGRGTARDGILAKVRAAVGDHSALRDAEYAAIPREYRRQGQSGQDELLSLLAQRLNDYDAVVYPCARHEIAATVAAAMAARGKTSLLRPEHLPEEWLPPSGNFPPVDGLPYTEIDK